jgi:hypothetical protein
MRIAGCNYLKKLILFKQKLQPPSESVSVIYEEKEASELALALVLTLRSGSSTLTLTLFCTPNKQKLQPGKTVYLCGLTTLQFDLNHFYYLARPTKLTG